MKSNITVVVASALSCAAGAATAHILTKKYVTEQYEALIEEEVDKAKVFYSQRHKTGEFADPVALAGDLHGFEPSDDTENDSSEDGISEDAPHDPTDDETPEAYEASVAQSEEVARTRIDYHNIARTYVGDDTVPDRIPKRDLPKPVSHPEDGESMESFEKRLINQAAEEVEEMAERAGEEDIVRHNIFESHGRPHYDEEVDMSERGNGRPYILTRQEWQDSEPNYHQSTLTYYEGDNVLTDDQEQPISGRDFNNVVGDEGNLRFGHGSEDMNVVYIRNDQLEIDFEVVRSLGRFADELGKGD